LPNARNITDRRFSREHKGKGSYVYFFNGFKIGDSSETGDAFEKAIWYNHFHFRLKQGKEGLENRKIIMEELRKLDLDDFLPRYNRDTPQPYNHHKNNK